MDDGERERTLRTLIALAEANNPNDCWDDTRAAAMLRAQSTPAELRALGMSEPMIAFVFSGTDDR